MAHLSRMTVVMVARIDSLKGTKPDVTESHQTLRRLTHAAHALLGGHTVPI